MRIWIQKPKTRRLFLAIPLDHLWRTSLSSCSRAIQRDDGMQAVPVRWVQPENFHITVRFIGAIESGCVRPLLVMLQALFSGNRAFSLPFARIEVATAADPKMIWVTFTQNDAFRNLVQKSTGHIAVFLSDKCHGAVLQNGHDVIPHVTLARMKGKINARNFSVPDGFPETLMVTSLILYESHTYASGSVYHEITRFKLHET